MKKRLLFIFGIITCWISNPKCYAQLPCALNGTYTITASQPTGGNNFSNFNEAIHKLDSCGVSGPVTFNVAQDIYYEQLAIGNIPGASFENTITIQSDPANINPVKINYLSSGASDNYVCKFDSASYVTIKGLHILAKDSIYGRVIAFTGYSRNVEIAENIIESYSSSSRIIENPPAVNSTISYSVINNNIIKGGNTGVYWRNNSLTSSLFEEGNIIANNIIETKGLNNNYAIYCEGQTSFSVYNNIINSLKGGIYITNSKKISILRNKIIAYSMNGIYINECTNLKDTNIIANNMISALGNTINGMQINNSENTFVLHNSILQNSVDGNALSISSSKHFDKGNYIINNNIANIGKGSVVNLMFNPNDVPYIFSMDYNNFYYKNGAILGIYEGDSASSLFEWRKISSYDSHSKNESPFFVNDTNLHISSLNLSIANPLSYIPLDIDDQMRSQINPTAGADEVPDISGNGCNTFTEIQVDSLLHDRFKISWNPGSGNNSFYLEYGPEGFLPGGSNGTKVTSNYPGTHPPLHITGLTANTIYDIYFGEICSSGSDTIKASKLSIKTKDICPDIDNIFISTLSQDSAVFSLNSFYENFDIEWGISGYQQGTGTTGLVKNPFTLDSLPPNTSYDLYVRPECKVYWYGPVTFSTLCDSSSILSGTYIIDKSQPTYEKIFNSFSDAISALNRCGISGPVVFNVKEGTYNEQILLEKIAGSSSINTITFQSDSGNIQSPEINYLALSNNDYVIRLHNASYISIKSLKVKILNSSNSLSSAILFTGIGSHNIIQNNLIEGVELSKGIYFSSTPGNNATDYDSCFISDNTIKYGGTGIAMDDIAAMGIGTGNVIENNFIQGFKGWGIRFLKQSHGLIYKNILESSSSLYFFGGGIEAAGDNNIVKSNNVVLTLNSTLFNAIGIGIGGNDISLVNNMILMQGNSPGEVQISAIWVYNYNGQSNIHLMYNTILNNINGSYGGLCIELNSYNIKGFDNNFLIGNNLVALQNGRIIDFKSPHLATNFISNNNNFYFTSGGSLGTYGTTLIPDLATWQSTTSLDTNSISVDPLFVSLTDLHAQSVLIDGKGIPIAEVTDDIDGDIRSATAPDIGADEFTPSPCFPSEDFQAVQRYSDSIQLSWTPGSGMEFIIEYGVKGFTPGEGMIITGITDSLYTISSLSPSTEYDFYLKDFCNVGDTSARIGPFTIKTLCIDNEFLSGTYTINSSIPSSATNFTSMGEVVSVLNNCGVKGPVTININEGSYSQKIALGDIYGTSAVNTVTFQPDPANTNTVEITSGGLQNSNYVIQFDNTRYVTFKGLTLSTGTTTYGTVLNFQGNSSHIVIDSNVIQGSQGSPSGVEQAVIKNDNIGTPRYVNDITIKNNTIHYGSYGIYWYGVGTGNPEKGTVIENNRIEGFYLEGIRSYYQDSLRIEKNTLISDRTISSISGMNINTNKYSQILANTFIQKAGKGIHMENNNENLLGNNMISITGNNNATKGISVANSDNQNLVFNSVFLNTSNSQAACVELFGTDTATMYNNNLVNTGGGYAITSGTSTELTADYNNLYVTGSHIGKWNGTDITALSSWQTQSGQDVNSVSTDPMFIATDDLHAWSPLINDKGTVYNSITTDIDGEIRSTTTPDIGADEFITYSHDLWAVEILNTLDSSCGDSNMTVSVQIINMGSQPATGFTVQAELTGTVAATLSETYAGTLSSGETDTVILSSFHAFNGGSVNIKAYIDYSSDQRTENDTLAAYAYILRSSVLNPQSAQGYFCEGHPYDTLYFPTGMDNSFLWKTTAGDVIGNTDSLVVGPLQSDTTFILSASEGCYKDGEIKITRSEMPVASFNVNLQSAEATKLTVDFNAGASTGANTYTWNFGDGQTGTGSTISHDYTANGSYDVQLIINGDCGSNTLIKTIKIRGVSIEENLISRSLEVYPNPTQNEIQVSFNNEGSESAIIRIGDLSGKVVAEIKLHNLNGSYNGKINLSHLAEGTYILRVESEEMRAIRRIVKE